MEKNSNSRAVGSSRRRNEETEDEGREERERRWGRGHRGHFSAPRRVGKRGYGHQCMGTYSYDREVIGPLVINGH